MPWVSRFRFPKFFSHRGKDAVQFAAGIAIDSRARVVNVSYGVADCVALVTSMPMAVIVKALRLGPVTDA